MLKIHGGANNRRKLKQACLELMGSSLIASKRKRSTNNDELSSWSSVNVTSMAFTA